MRLGLIWLLVLLFIEIWSIIAMSDSIGGWATLVLLAAGLIFGLKLMRSQGINAMMKAAQGVQPGGSPLAPLATGIVKAFAGILFIIPGFVSDFFALLILLPFVRNGFARHLAKKGQFQGFANGSFGQNGFGGFGKGGFGKGGFGGFGGPNAANEGNVYEHDGSAKTGEKPDEKLIDGQVIEHKRDK